MFSDILKFMSAGQGVNHSCPYNLEKHVTWLHNPSIVNCPYTHPHDSQTWLFCNGSTCHSLLFIKYNYKYEFVINDHLSDSPIIVALLVRGVNHQWQDGLLILSPSLTEVFVNRCFHCYTVGEWYYPSSERVQNPRIKMQVKQKRAIKALL